MEEDQKREFETLLKGESYVKVKAMNKTAYDQGIELGLKQGKELGDLQARRQVLRRLIERKFGPLPPSAASRLDTMGVDQLNPMTNAIFDVSSLKDLDLVES